MIIAVAVLTAPFVAVEHAQAAESQLSHLYGCVQTIQANEVSTSPQADPCGENIARKVGKPLDIRTDLERAVEKQRSKFVFDHIFP